jgi:LacI family transcriptional regulator
MASSTLRDVADMAGVSIGTASQALNNRPNVAPETRTRVLEAAAALGYPLKAPATPAANDTSLAVLGMLTKHDHGLPLDTNPFYHRIQVGIERECRARDLSLMVSTIEVDPQNRPLEWPAMIREQRVDGLLLLGTYLDEMADQVQSQFSGPVVLVDSYAPSLPYDSVVSDNVDGAFKAVQHLLDLGHTAIGLVGSNLHDSPPSIRERRQGYHNALYSRGIAPYVEESELSRPSAYAATKRLLARTPDISAVFACNDEAAMGVMDAARELGRHIPHDLSLVGFDNIELAKDLYPPLTTVQVHKAWMGQLSVQLLLERARYPEKPRTTTIVATQLVERESTARRVGVEDRGRRAADLGR